MNPKEIAAQQAVQFIEEGMIVGLGTGSTAYWAIQQIGQRVQDGLQIRAVASSQSSEDLARQAGIPMVEFSEITSIDLTIDGADEVDDQLNLIKGGGGALLRKKSSLFIAKGLLSSWTNRSGWSIWGGFRCLSRSCHLPPI